MVGLPEYRHHRQRRLASKFRIVEVEIDNRRAALLVDSLIGQQQLVVKSLETNLHRVGGMAGATILGDGRVALILDVSAFTRNVGTRNTVKAYA